MAWEVFMSQPWTWYISLLLSFHQLELRLIAILLCKYGWECSWFLCLGRRWNGVGEQLANVCKWESEKYLTLYLVYNTVVLIILIKLSVNEDRKTKIFRNTLRALRKACVGQRWACVCLWEAQAGAGMDSDMLSFLFVFSQGLAELAGLHGGGRALIPSGHLSLFWPAVLSGKLLLQEYGEKVYKKAQPPLISLSWLTFLAPLGEMWTIRPFLCGE